MVGPVQGTAPSLRGAGRTGSLYEWRGAGGPFSDARPGALAQHGHAARAHVVVLLVGHVVDADPRPGGHHHVLVEDRPPHIGTLTDVHAVHEHAVLHAGTALDADTR